jgi:tRNA (Thr-GGU) A37 N-methylase
MVLYILDLDIIDGTPLLDIKPYVPVFEEDDQVRGGVRSGWLAGRLHDGDGPRADSRFSKQKEEE